MYYLYLVNIVVKACFSVNFYKHLKTGVVFKTPGPGLWYWSKIVTTNKSLNSQVSLVFSH
jgi:hypothetical protein